MINMQKRLIVISDMFGQVNESTVTNNYMEVTKQFFKKMGCEIDSYSSTELGGINNSGNTDNTHQLFLDFGIKNAATTLSNSIHQYDIGIGFSLGGLILWEACKLNNSLVKHLVCVSSTRLRYEAEKIKPAKTTLIYGESDSYAPSLSIIKELSDHYSIIPNQGHELYKKQVVLEELLISLS